MSNNPTLSIMGFYIFCCCTVIVICTIAKQQKTHSYATFLVPNAKSYAMHDMTQGQKAPLIDSMELLPNPEISVHASALVAKDSKLMALFYAGQREGATDVKIYQNFLDLKAGGWNASKVLLTPEKLTKLSGRFIKKLGNPIVFKDSKGRVHLFVVGVSLGGWATSRIYQFYFSDDLKNIHYRRELRLGPFANYSHLVRTPSLPLENGGFILAFSHEMWHKFPLIAFFDVKGDMLFAKRLNNLKAQLQPSVVATTPKDCVALYRTNNRYNTNTYYQTCTDSAKTWNDVKKSNIHNYDSSVLLVNIGNEVVLIANDGKHNPLWNGENKGDRQSLSIYWLQDRAKGHFVYLDTIDTAKKGGEVSYPSAYLYKDKLHVAYTYNRKAIKHASINVQYLLDKIARAKL